DSSRVPGLPPALAGGAQRGGRPARDSFRNELATWTGRLEGVSRSLGPLDGVERSLAGLVELDVPSLQGARHLVAVAQGEDDRIVRPGLPIDGTGDSVGSRRRGGST